MTTKKKCKAKASASGEQCKRNAVTDGYCKQHYEQIHPQADAESPVAVIEQAGEPESPHTVAQYRGPEFERFEVAKRIAHTLANSSLVPDAYRGRPNDCFVAINMGREVGLGEFAAIQSIAVIDGKPCLYGDGLIGVVRSSPLCEWINETMSEDGTIAYCEAKRKGDPHVKKASYSMTDAMMAGIDSKFNWKKHPKRMLQMRARAYCLRDAFPDVLKGLGVVEEMQDHDDTPPPVTQYDLPSPETAHMQALQEAEAAKEDAMPITLTVVERAMHQSDSMEQLLKAAEMAKQLSDNEQTVARITYKKMRKALMDTGEQHG